MKSKHILAENSFCQYNIACLFYYSSLIFLTFSTFMLTLPLCVQMDETIRVVHAFGGSEMVGLDEANESQFQNVHSSP